jgi:hypothetical protein
MPTPAGKTKVPGKIVGEGVGVEVTDDVGVAVIEADAPTVTEDVAVGVTVGEVERVAEHDGGAERPATSQQEHEIGAADASGQKFPIGQIDGIVAPLAQKLPEGQGSVATVQRMPAATPIVSE